MGDGLLVGVAMGLGRCFVATVVQEVVLVGEVR